MRSRPNLPAQQWGTHSEAPRPSTTASFVFKTGYRRETILMPILLRLHMQGMLNPGAFIWSPGGHWSSGPYLPTCRWAFENKWRLSSLPAQKRAIPSSFFRGNQPVWYCITLRWWWANSMGNFTSCALCAVSCCHVCLLFVLEAAHTSHIHVCSNNVDYIYVFLKFSSCIFQSWHHHIDRLEQTISLPVMQTLADGAETSKDVPHPCLLSITQRF